MKRGTPQSFTSGVSAVLDAAQDEARALGYGWVSTEHLLLGLIREADGLVAEVLRSLGIEVEGAGSRCRMSAAAGSSRLIRAGFR